MTVKGARGSVRWGYHRAAELETWVATRKRTEATWSLRARVVRADPFLGARSALYFVVPLKGGRAWQWPVLALNIAGGALTARLGPMEGEGEGAHIARRSS